MRNVISVFGLVGVLLAASPASAEQQTVTLAVDKMYCALCPLTVTKAIERGEGVSAVSVDFDRKEALVTYEDTIANLEAIAAASTNAGFSRPAFGRYTASGTSRARQVAIARAPDRAGC
jgi:mercuric ion binding protein